MRKILLAALVALLFVFSNPYAAKTHASEKTGMKAYGTAALMVVIERESGSVIVIDSINHELIGRVEGLGNLTHATMVFSRDGRFAYVIGRVGNLSKVDLMEMKVAGRAKVGENTIGVAISRDNKYLMVCGYEPGGVYIIDSDNLKVLKEIPAIEEMAGGSIRSRTIGPVDTPDNLMIFGLMDGNAVWVVDMKKDGFPVIKKFRDAGDAPYDQFTTPDGRYYLVGLLKSDWMGLLDTWKLDGIRRVDVRLKSEKPADNPAAKVPVYHIPHFKSWGIAGDLAFVPALGEKRVIVYNIRDWSIVKSIPISGTGLFVVVRPGGRQVWVDNVGAPGSAEERLVEVIDVESLEVKHTIDAGKGALDPQFTPRGEAAYISVRDEDRVAVYDTDTYTLIKNIPAKRPSGIFGTDRAGKFGM